MTLPRAAMRALALAAGCLMAPVAGTAQQAHSSGTGFFVNPAGWVLTNDHVIDGCGSVRVAGRGTAERIIRDRAHDLAAFHLPGPEPATALPIRTARARLAEPILVLGYPLSDVLGESVRVTTGTVSALSGLRDDTTRIQISAPIQPGNSGGPLLDAAGRVLGVVQATLADHAYERAQNVNFAIDGATAAEFLRDNGIAMLPQPEATDAAPDLVAHAEHAAPATVRVLCEGAGTGPGAGAGMAPGRAGAPEGMIIVEGVDAVGFDYRRITDTSLPGCRAQCEHDAACRAFTFNRRHDVCLLKDSAALLADNDDAVGGIARVIEHEVVHSGFTIRSGVDSVGGDYDRLRNSDFLSCFAACGVDARCRAFAYVSGSADCWLKERVGRLTTQPGVEFGAR